MSNSHVTACSDGRNGLTFLYEVRPGPCLESFGIQVAEMANMPASIIIDAKRKAKQLENFGYRKKKSDTSVNDEANDDPNEKRAAAAAFLDEFKKLPINTMTNEEIKRTLLPLVQKYRI